jgi:hypothetical protein
MQDLPQAAAPSGEKFLRIWVSEFLHIEEEINRAIRLYLWYKARVTVEYVAESGHGCGAVYGLSPLTDKRISMDFAEDGFCHPTEKIRHWRRVLRRFGYVTWDRAPNGLRTFVAGMGKFPAEKREPLPRWAAELFKDLTRAERLSQKAMAKSGQ